MIPLSLTPAETEALLVEWDAVCEEHPVPWGLRWTPDGLVSVPIRAIVWPWLDPRSWSYSRARSMSGARAGSRSSAGSRSGSESTIDRGVWPREETVAVEDRVGQDVCVRYPGGAIYLGHLVAATPTELTLERPVWVASTGRVGAFFRGAYDSACEWEPMGSATDIPRAHAEVSPWPHGVPTEAYPYECEVADG